MNYIVLKLLNPISAFYDILWHSCFRYWCDLRCKIAKIRQWHFPTTNKMPGAIMQLSDYMISTHVDYSATHIYTKITML